MRSRARQWSDESGFTLIEVMVASAILLGGLLAVMLLLGNAQLASTSTKAREQGVSLQRELIEIARGVSYDKLQPTSVVANVQGASGADLGDATAAAGWDVRRRGVTYHVALGVCAVDDPSDGLGVHDGTFCATGPGGTTSDTCLTLLGRTGSIQGAAAASGAGASAGDCGIDLNLDGTVDNLSSAEVGCSGAGCGGTTDTNPDDYKRIVSLVRWDRGTGNRFALQTTTVANPGLSAAPSVTSLVLLNGVAELGGGDLTAQLRAGFSAIPQTATWYLDGTAKGSVTTPGSLTWDFNWALGTPGSGSEVLDGSYVLSAKAFDVYGNYNGTKAATVKLNRRQPYAPVAFEAGRNGGQIEFEWSQSPERDIVGYRVYRENPSGSDVKVCDVVATTACIDNSPPAITPLRYRAVAVDRDGAGSLREGDFSSWDTIGTTNTAPTTAPVLAPITFDAAGNPVLTWSAITDPDAGDSIDFYRIYRNGQQYDDRYDRTQTGAQLTFTDTKANGMKPTYYVVGVDTNKSESPMSNGQITP